jgi:hypothetical protein
MNGQAHFIDKSTQALIISLIFRNRELNTELAFTDDNTIHYTLPIDEFMDVKPQTLSEIPIRTKTHQKKNKAKDLISLESITVPHPTISPGPIARLSDVSEWSLLQARIEETLKFVKTLEDEDIQTATLQELKSFVLKATKQRKDLESERTKLTSLRRRSGADLAAMLYRFSLKL